MNIKEFKAISKSLVTFVVMVVIMIACFVARLFMTIVLAIVKMISNYLSKKAHRYEQAEKNARQKDLAQ